MAAVRMRVPAAAFVLISLLAAARPASAQEPPPRIPFVVVDVHGSMPRFP